MSDEDINVRLPIGAELGPILEDIAASIWDFEQDNPTSLHQFDNYGFRAAIKIFSSAVMDRALELQEKEDMPKEARLHMAEELGEKIRRLVKVYTDVDTRTLYNDE